MLIGVSNISAEGLHFSAFHFVGSTFSSNVTGKSYSVKCTGENMNCGTKNVIYFISLELRHWTH